MRFPPHIQLLAAKKAAGTAWTEVEKAEVTAFVDRAKAGKISQKDLAETFGISQPAVSKLIKLGMPTTSIEAAAEWRDERPKRRASPREKEIIETIASIPGKVGAISAPKIINNLEPFDLEFQQAKNMREAAYSRAMAVSAAGQAGAYASWMKAWADASKVCLSLTERYDDLREKSRQLVDIDEVISGVGQEVCEWRRLFQTLGHRLAGRIPAEHVKTVNDEIERVQSDLMPRAKTVAANLFTAKEEPDEETEQE